jgi:hypothetical protein
MIMEDTVLTEALQNLSIKEEKAPISTQEIANLLEEGLSISAIKKHAKEIVHGCMTCPACFDTSYELRSHLFQRKYSNGKKKNKCFYGVERLNNEKEDFVSRLNTKRREMKKEGAEFKDTHVLYEEMSPAEKLEYIKLLRLTLLQIPTKRK